MDRRSFIYYGGLSSIAGCSRNEQSSNTSLDNRTYNWRMATSWPPNFPGHGVSANRLANNIEELTGGRIKIEIFSAGELVPAFEVLDAVSRDTVHLAHSAPVYWRGKIPASLIYGGIPFGMTSDIFNSWLFHSDGLELWRKAYSSMDIIPFPAGNTGQQMGGWFNREINSLEDLSGLKMRIPGLGGEVMQKAGILPVNLPASEIFTALQTGAIDATEWVGPYNDMALGLQQVARYYYYPGWQEPSGQLELIVSRNAFNSLPPDLKKIIEIACFSENSYLLAEFNMRNQQALNTLKTEHKVDIRRFPNDVLEELKKHTNEILDELSNNDPLFKEIYESYNKFLGDISPWLEIIKS